MVGGERCEALWKKKFQYDRRTESEGQKFRLCVEGKGGKCQALLPSLYLRRILDWTDVGTIEKEHRGRQVCRREE